jgi:hypothetical protein
VEANLLKDIDRIVTPPKVRTGLSHLPLARAPTQAMGLWCRFLPGSANFPRLPPAVRSIFFTCALLIPCSFLQDESSPTPPPPPSASQAAVTKAVSSTEKPAPADDKSTSLFGSIPTPKLPEQAAALGALKDLLGKAPGVLEGVLEGKDAAAGSVIGRLQGLFAPKDVGGAAPPPPKAKAADIFEDDDFSAPKKVNCKSLASSLS